MASPDTESWGEADADGMCVRWLSDPRRSSLRGRRLRRHMPAAAADPGAWPEGWRTIARIWLKDARAEHTIRRDSLLRRAGADHTNDALRLIRHLVELGQLGIEERRAAHGWTTVGWHFVDPTTLRRSLGMEEPGAGQRAWQTLRAQPLDDDDLREAAASLDELPPRTAIARFGLLQALQRWRQAGRARSVATRRDFAYFARGDTKAVTPAEWAWLDAMLDVAADGIATHQATLLVAGGVSLIGTDGRIDCAALSGIVGIAADSLATLRGVENPPERWLVVENRSAFEHLARRLPRSSAAIWLPGYPPLWWREAVGQLLAQAPAEAWIACDPDPDGVLIALQAGTVWHERGLAWRAWQMAPEQLAGLPHHRPLSARDKALAEQLLAMELPAELRGLLDWIRVHDRKGEQEALFLPPPHHSAGADA